MNEKFNYYERLQLKKWIKKRFISEVDIHNLSYKEAITWIMALQELANDLIHTLTFSQLGTHNIVPFRRRKR